MCFTGAEQKVKVEEMAEKASVQTTAENSYWWRTGQTWRSVVARSII